MKGYPPGIRENGGQYTHAATWQVIALARLGRGEEALALFSMLNPVNRTATRSGVQRYRVEPYVVAADVYSIAPHSGRGGWTWYTGAAGWLYRAGVEAILGLELRGRQLWLAPCIPPSWTGYSASLRYRSARYDVQFHNPDGVASGILHIDVDGRRLESGTDRIDLEDDDRVHDVQVRLGRADARSTPELAQRGTITPADAAVAP